MGRGTNHVGTKARSTDRVPVNLWLILCALPSEFLRFMSISFLSEIRHLWFFEIDIPFSPFSPLFFKSDKVFRVSESEGSAI